MKQPDEITMEMDRIAQLLESHGYAVEAHYASATIIVWTDNWPIVIEIKQRENR